MTLPVRHCETDRARWTGVDGWINRQTEPGQTGRWMDKRTDRHIQIDTCGDNKHGRTAGLLVAEVDARALTAAVVKIVESPAVVVGCTSSVVLMTREITELGPGLELVGCWAAWSGHK